MKPKAGAKKPHRYVFKKRAVPRGAEDNAPEKTAKKVTSFQKAKQQFERIQVERRVQAEERRKLAERRQGEKDQALSFRKRKNQAVNTRTKKGQPNFNAQMACIVEKLTKKRELEAKKKP